MMNSDPKPRFQREIEEILRQVETAPLPPAPSPEPAPRPLPASIARPVMHQDERRPRKVIAGEGARALLAVGLVLLGLLLYGIAPWLTLPLTLVTLAISIAVAFSARDSRRRRS